MSKRRRFYLYFTLLAVALAGVVWFAPSSDTASNKATDWATISDEMLHLPTAPSQPEWPPSSPCPRDVSVVVSGMTIDQDRSEPAVVSYGGAKVRIAPGVIMSGNVTLCGGSVELIVQGHLTGNAIVYGSQAKVILIDDGEAPRVDLGGADVETIRCGVKRASLPPCDPEYFRE